MTLLRGLFLVFILALLVQEGNMWWRRRRRRRCPVRNCSVSGWSSWSRCSQDCGNAGTQRRTRRVTAGATCGGRCPYHLQETRACNRRCYNGGTPRGSGLCACRPGFTGRCCRSDVNECTRKPCQHICVNTFGSYTCRCHACYTKVGTRCDLRMCKISNKCYNYGTPNPSNFCQHCTSSNKYAWTNNNGKPCNDQRVQTKNDRCLNGACVGTPYSCLPCEQHDGNECPLKAGYCVIQHKGNRTCFSNKQVNPSNQCQKCDANNNQTWTDIHGSPCNDQNVQTKNDRCESGRCVGTPYSCLSCEQHDGTGCPLKAGYCVIDHQGNRTCFSNKQVNPSNQCQLCKPSISDSSWTNKTIVNGNWTSWEDWSVCSKSCKSGNQSRRRSCTNPPPSECGKTCSGQSVESRTCNTQPCPVNGNWTRWGSWSECSKSCEGGIQRRTRKCFNPPPSFGGRDCTGPNMESRECNKHRCPVDCKSSMNGEYPHYSNCSKYVTCYAGKKHVKCCRAGFHFNPVIKRCDLPQNVNCTTREEQYAAIGCFTDRTKTPRAFTELVANLRNDIDWYDLKKTIQTCAKKVREICGWKYFGIQFYGECWSGQDNSSSYDMLGNSKSCVVGVGKENANFVYKLID